MKTKIKNALIIIVGMALFLGIMALYEHHKDLQRADYAQVHNCTWTIQGSHDICK